MCYGGHELPNERPPLLLRIQQHVHRHAIALYAGAGGGLGAGAWWLSTGGTTWALLLPFIVGLSSRHSHAFAVSAAYHFVALIHWPSMANDAFAAWAAWLAAGLVAGGAWSLVPDPQGRALHTGVRLVFIWALTWATPVGWFGAAHPMLAWAFPGDGFMGPLSQLAAPLITAFFVVAIRLDDGAHRWSWRSGRFLCVALLLILQVKGMGNHTVVSRHASGVAALHGRWLESAEGPGLSVKERAEKVEQALRGLGLPHQAPPLVAMLAVAGLGLDDEKVNHRLEAAVSSTGVSLVVASRSSSGSDWQGVLVPSVAPSTRGPVVCGHSWMPGWAMTSGSLAVCDDELDTLILTRALPQKVAVVFPGTSLSPGWLSIRTLTDRPDVWLLIAEADAARSEGALRVALKHQKANALMSKRPLVGALLLRAKE